MIDKKFIFLAGHHRSGTSLLHKIMKRNDAISGLSHTGVLEDEGQHIQSVYQPGNVFGGPGKYIFESEAYMDELHPLATEKSAYKIMQAWEKFYDPKCEYYIEKSPPNLIRTRFLQHLFPNSTFIFILRHPLAVGYATQKWSRTSIESLVEHTLRGFEILAQDLPFLNSAYVLRYEDFIAEPQNEIDQIYKKLKIPSNRVQNVIKADGNEKYFDMWRKNRAHLANREAYPISDKLESRANNFGYSLNNFEEVLPCPLTGINLTA